MLDAGEIEEMRSEVEATLGGSPAGALGTAVVSRHTLTPDGIGGHTETWAAVGTAVCRFAPAGGGEDVVGGAANATADAVVTLAHDVDVRPADRLTIAGTAYEVGVVKLHSWGVCTRVDAQRVRVGGTAAKG